MSSIPVSDAPELTPAEKLRIALDLAEAGCDMKRAQLQREHPDAAPEEIQRLLIAWLHERPGAEHGDAEGRPNPDRFKDA